MISVTTYYNIQNISEIQIISFWKIELSYTRIFCNRDLNFSPK